MIPHNKYWTKEKCIEDAKKYFSKSKWARYSGGAFKAAKRNDWIDACCQHMTIKGNKFKRLIYVFEFSDKSVYVGLTQNFQERKNEHLNPNREKKSSVYSYIQETGLIPNYKETTDYLPVEMASKLEGEVVTLYKIMGWKILNRVKTGGIGGSSIKWTIENCVREAQKYHTKLDFIKNASGAYDAAHENGWLNQCYEHMIITRKLWSLEKCKEDALKYQTRTEWARNSSGYKSAVRNKWLEFCCTHM